MQVATSVTDNKVIEWLLFLLNPNACALYRIMGMLCVYKYIDGYVIQNKIYVSCLIHVLLRTVSKVGDRTRKLIGRNVM